MRLVVLSHKKCWPDPNSESGFATDGGFPLQMKAISELFTETKLLIPCDYETSSGGLTELTGRHLSVLPLTIPKGKALERKINMIGWMILNSKILWHEIRMADGVHTPIPGDIGTVGMIFALLQSKPLFVRHCGNWFVQRTFAERFWKWSIERFAGGRNVMLATGGGDQPPSNRNLNIKWIFSTSLRRDQLAAVTSRELPSDGKLRIIIACRQEDKKGTDKVIDSIPLLLKSFPGLTLDIVGDGSLLNRLKNQVKMLDLEGRVRFHGKVALSRVLALLKQSHIFCYPTSASEGFPKVVLEALASGLPVVTTKVSVLPELIGKGAGVLLDETTPAAIADAIGYLCRDSVEYQKISQRAIETARCFTLETWRDTIGDTLREAWGMSSIRNEFRGLPGEPS